MLEDARRQDMCAPSIIRQMMSPGDASSSATLIARAGDGGASVSWISSNRPGTSTCAQRGRIQRLR